MRGFHPTHLAWAISLLLSSTASARPVYVDAEATGANDGSSWENAFTDLQAALSIAGEGDSVRVAGGVYTLTGSLILGSGVHLIGSYAGHPSSEANERDFALHPSILSGEVSYPIVQVSGGDQMAVVDGFVVTRGSSENGGGLSIDGGSVTVRNARFEDNVATGHGGGVYCEEGNIVLERVEFINNTVGFNDQIGNGGGLAIRSSDAVVVDCAFRGNFADRQGGALFFQSFDNSLEVTRCLAENNSADIGGAFRLLNGSATVRDGIFRSNTATTNSGGGAIYGLSDESSFVNCIFLDNSADGIGGAIYFAGFLTVSPVLTNCSFVGNQSVSSTVTVLGPSINPIVTNCILWGNSGGTAQISRGTVSHSIVEGSGGSDVWNMPASVIDGGGNLDADPLFVDAAGGDLHVTVLSPAIDSGDIGAPDLPPFDLDGAPRVIGPAVDMGVYEFPSALDAVFSDNLGLSLLRSLRPNPSSGPIEVVFELASPSDVSLDVCDVRGRVVSTLVRGVVPSGMHRVNWAPLPTHASSVYFVRIRAGKIMESRKVLVLR